MRFFKVLAVSTAVLCLPVAMAGQGVTAFTDTGAAFAKSNKANKGGKGQHDKGRAGGKKPDTAKVKPASRKAAAATTDTVALAHPSELKSLNSLNRNINGLMNSSDPKMAPFRAYVLASADRDAAAAALDQATADLEESALAYQALVDAGLANPDPALARVDLLDRVNALLEAQPAEDDPAYEEWAAEFASVSGALSALDQYEADLQKMDDARQAIAEADEAISEEALKEAIAAAINETGQGPVTGLDITPEVEAWVSERLGIGDADGLIDDYLSQESVEQDAEAMSEGDNMEVAQAE